MKNWIIDFKNKAGKKLRAKDAGGSVNLDAAERQKVLRHLASHDMKVVGARVVHVDEPWHSWVRPGHSGVDLNHVNVVLLNRLAAVGRHYGKMVTAVSGKRSREQQQHAYDLYLAGKGPLAAKPGTSNHERGEAVDAYIGNVPIGSMPNAHHVLDVNKLVLGASGEEWHVERSEVGTWRA